MHKEKVIEEMKKVFDGVPYGIEHTLKVLENAEQIMDGEAVGEELREIISITAILHDIGAIEAQRKYGSMDGAHQEKEGPPIARGILENIGYSPQAIERICFIIGNHHTPSQIDGIDFRIQWEADLLENLTALDRDKDAAKIRSCIEENFKTKTGRKLADERFLL